MRLLRSRLRQGGRVKTEGWLSLPTRRLMASFGKRVKLSTRGVTELVLEHATPLYLREVGRRLDELLPLLERIRIFEYWGIKPAAHPTLPSRIGTGPGAVVLDPHEHFRLRERALPIMEQLGRYGLSPDRLLALVPTKRHPRSVSCM